MISKCNPALMMVLLLLTSVVGARQGDERLEPLFDTLLSAASFEQAHSAARQIWGIWHESGDEEVDKFLLRGIMAMNSGRYDIALAFFDKVIDRDPEFAEGWNKRATVHWLMSNHDESMADIQRTLALEPRHFGAVSGMGLIFMERGDADGALRAFEQVLRIHPQDPGALQRVEELRQRVGQDSV